MPLGHTQDQFDDRAEALDEGAVAFRMPPLATTWNELDEILKNRNLILPVPWRESSSSRLLTPPGVPHSLAL